MYPFKHTEVFKREIQPHEMVKSLMGKCSSLITPNLFNSVISSDF